MSRLNVGGAGASTAPLPFEMFDEIGAGGSQGVALHVGGSAGDATTANVAFWTQILGAGHVWNAPNAIGPRFRSSNVLGQGARTNCIDWRLNERWSLLAGATTAILGQRKFTFQCAVCVPAGDLAEIGIRQDANPLPTSNNILGYVIRAVGGNWVGFRRLTTGVVEAGVAVQNSLSTARPRLLRIEFTTGPTPVLSFTMDGLPLFTVSGEANMPEIGAVSTVTFCPAVASSGNPIFTTNAYMKMERLA